MANIRRLWSRLPPKSRVLFMLAATLVCVGAGLLGEELYFRAGNRPTTTIVRTGPYRFGRNPIYLAFSLLQLGIALWVNSLWVVLTLLASVTLMSLVVIPREERYLKARFPSEYPPYKGPLAAWYRLASN